MLSTLDALGPTLYSIAWYKLECPHDGVYKVENQHTLTIKSQTNDV